MFLARSTNNEANSKAEINLPLLSSFREELKSEQLQGYGVSVTSDPIEIDFKIGHSFYVIILNLDYLNQNLKF